MDEEYLPHIFEPFFSRGLQGRRQCSRNRAWTFHIKKHCGYGGWKDLRCGHRKVSLRNLRVVCKAGDFRRKKKNSRHHLRKHEFHTSYLKTLVVDDVLAVCESAVVTLKGDGSGGGMGGQREERLSTGGERALEPEQALRYDSDRLEDCRTWTALKRPDASGPLSVRRL